MPDAQNLDGLPFEERIAARYGVDEGRLGDLRSAVESHFRQVLHRELGRPLEAPLDQVALDAVGATAFLRYAVECSERNTLLTVLRDAMVRDVEKTLNDYVAVHAGKPNTAERMAQVTAQLDAGLHAAAKRYE